MLEESFYGVFWLVKNWWPVKLVKSFCTLLTLFYILTIAREFSGDTDSVTVNTSKIPKQNNKSLHGRQMHGPLSRKIKWID